TRRSSPTTRSAPTPSAGASGRVRSGTTPSRPTSASRSAASSSPGSDEKAGPKACIRTWRPKRSSSISGCRNRPDRPAAESAAWQPEHALRDDVALHLRGAGIDGGGARPQVAVLPASRVVRVRRVLVELPVRPGDPAGGFHDLLLELAPQ